MNKQQYIIPVALGAELIFLMYAGVQNFLAVQQHIVKAQSTSPPANTTVGAPGTSPANKTTVSHHPLGLKTFSPPIIHHCGNKYISCGHSART